MVTPLTLPQFYKLLAILEKDSRVSRLVIDGLIGSCEAEGVDFSWKFDGTANAVTITITAKHGLFVSHISDATIYGKLHSEFISQVQ